MYDSVHFHIFFMHFHNFLEHCAIYYVENYMNVKLILYIAYWNVFHLFNWVFTIFTIINSLLCKFF